MLPIALLAAGESRRMRGGDKLLEPVMGRPLLTLLTDRALQSGGSVYVVLPSSNKARLQALAGRDVTPVFVPKTKVPSMSASLKTAIRACANAPGLMIALADMPEIDANDFARLRRAHEAAPHEIQRAATHEGKPGHPIVFPNWCFTALQALEGDQGARALLQDWRQQTQYVKLQGNRALIDLDTPEDWLKWRQSRRALCRP